MKVIGTTLDMRSLRQVIAELQGAGLPVVSLLPGDVAAGDTVSRAMLAGAKAAEQAAEEREEGEES